jgi:predicted dehydrogenase
MFASLKGKGGLEVVDRTGYDGPVVKIAMVGCGAVAALHHVPGIAYDVRSQLVCLCDFDEKLRTARAEEWNVLAPAGGFVLAGTIEEVLAMGDGVDAVIICTPNFAHKDAVIACVAAGKHVMCEKPLALSSAEAYAMVDAANDAGVVHMTALTYRFHPGLKYLKHLAQSGSLGGLRHFRSQRFLDFPETSWSWRQYKRTAGAGDIYDMTIHRIDFAVDIMGPISEVTGAATNFVPRTTNPDGTPCDPSEVDDWSALIGRFANGAVGVWEGSTLMKGRHNGGLGHEWAEVNGSKGSAVYQIQEPTSILYGEEGDSLVKRGERAFPLTCTNRSPYDTQRICIVYVWRILLGELCIYNGERLR